jgi:hypothetical protein
MEIVRRTFVNVRRTFFRIVNNITRDFIEIVRRTLLSYAVLVNVRRTLLSYAVLIKTYDRTIMSVRPYAQEHTVTYVRTRFQTNPGFITR